MLAVLVGVGEVDLVLLHLGLGQLGTELDVQAQLLEFLQRDLGDVRVGGTEEVGQGFEHGHFGTQAAPHAAQLQADHAGADHAQALGHFVDVQRAGVVDDVLAVELGERQLDRHRAGGQDHVGGADGLLGAVVAGDLDLVALQQLALAEEAGDLVGLEQLATPPVNCLTILSLRPMKVPRSTFGVLHGDAVHRQVVRDVVELLGRIQQRLGRDAAHVEAGAAEGLLAVLAGPGVDAGGLQAELRGADRGVITGRAAADDDDVEFVAHDVFP